MKEHFNVVYLPIRYVVAYKILENPVWRDDSRSKGLVAQRRGTNLMLSLDLHKSQAPVVLATRETEME